jgi:hypothetical protein
MSISSGAAAHPLLAAVTAVHDRLDQVTGGRPHVRRHRRQGHLLRELTRVLSRVSALRADVLAVAADVAVEGIARTPGREWGTSATTWHRQT